MRRSPTEPPRNHPRLPTTSTGLSATARLPASPPPAPGSPPPPASPPPAPGSPPPPASPPPHHQHRALRHRPPPRLPAVAPRRRALLAARALGLGLLGPPRPRRQPARAIRDRLVHLDRSASKGEGRATTTSSPVTAAACSASSATSCTATATAAFVVVSPHFRVSTRHPSSLSPAVAGRTALVPRLAVAARRRLPRALPPCGLPLVPASDHWGNWTVLLSCLGVCLVAADAPAYRVVLDYQLPLLLFRADLRRVLRSSGALLLAFLLGSDAVVCDSVASASYS
ncbi:hypothetical protein ZWY2020_050555 [Hordeum vulgare]|nr:hypothetical protein ZWY2020_050555 [Hordeum vulgare]